MSFIRKEKEIENCRMKSEINDYKPTYHYILEKKYQKLKVVYQY